MVRKLSKMIKRYSTLKFCHIYISITFCIALFAMCLFGRNTGVSTYKLNYSVAKQNRLIKIYPVSGESFVYVGGVKKLTPEEMDRIPYLEKKTKTRQLPANFSNSKKKYFPNPLVKQGSHGSCAQASGIAHHFTYIMNVLNSETKKPYEHHFTWNFLNGGINAGSNTVNGWELVNENGIPSSDMYDISIWGNYAKQVWMSGYDKYYAGMKNRYLEYHKIDISTTDGIITLKQWIFNFGDGSESGGLASFDVNSLQPMFNSELPKIKSGAQKGWPCIAAWGHTGGHAMLIVGWDDEIEFDVNYDGKITNDLDITKDGVVDVKDMEKGAWLVANTWGENWSGGLNVVTNGFYYMMYRAGALGAKSGYIDTNSIKSDGKLGQTKFHLNNGGLYSNNHVLVLRGKKVSDKIKQQLAYKVEIEHSSRGNISISSGVSNDINANIPEYSHRHSVFNYQGGAFPMKGDGTGTIEIGLDVKDLVNHIDEKIVKYFLTINSNGGTGEVKSFSLMDYRGNSLVETKCDQTNIPIVNGQTMLSIYCESDYEPLNISTTSLYKAEKDAQYFMNFTASGGMAPYSWKLLENIYYEIENTEDYPNPLQTLEPDDPDDGIAEVKLDFEFPFYGKKYNKIYVVTDGNIFFSSGFEYIRTPVALAGIKAIAALGADLLYESGDKITFSGNTDKATIRWKTKHIWGVDGSIDVDLDFAVTIHKNGKIEYFYASDLWGDINNMAMGVSDGEGACITFDYATLSDIPDNYKTAIKTEDVLHGTAMSRDGEFSGVPENDTGAYRMSVAVTDALDITKVKTFTFVVGGVNKTIIDIITTPLTLANASHGIIIFNFGIYRSAKVSLEAFALNGRKIQTVYSGKMKAGLKSIVWNTKNKLSNGVYLCKLTIGEQSVVVKVSVFRH